MKHYFPEINHIFIDLDGVLADFIGGVSELFGYPRDSMLDDWEPGVSTIEQILDVSTTEMISEIKRQGMEWWPNLKPLPWWRELMAVIEAAQAETSILTAPMISAQELTGKIWWVSSYLPNYRHRIHMTREKHLMAAPGRLLIDDNDENCQRFIEAGGAAIVYPQPWNSAHLYAGRPLPGVINQLVEYGIIPTEQIEGSENGES